MLTSSNLYQGIEPGRGAGDPDRPGVVSSSAPP